MDKQIKEICMVMSSMNEAICYLRQNGVTNNVMLIDNLIEAIKSCNSYILANENNSTKAPDIQAFILCATMLKEGCNCIEELANNFDLWFKTIISLLTSDDIKENIYANTKSYKELKYGIDKEFSRYIELVRKSSIQDLYYIAMENLKKIKQKDENFYKILTIDYRGWYFPGNWLEGIDGKNNSLITNRMNVLKNHIDDFEWFFDRLSDYRSKALLNAIINNWLTFSVDDLRKASDSTFKSCLDPDIIRCNQDEVFVDAGAYIGDTVIDYINTYGTNYKRIYTYEINKESFDILKKNLSPLQNIVNNWKGVSDKKGVMYLNGVSSPFHGNKLGNSGLYEVEVVSIDEDIKEPVTFIKIDVEGVDKEAICGAKMHIKNEHPKLAIDSYHKLEDIVQVPMLVNKLDPTYKFYLRHPASDILFATNYSIFAV